MTQQIKLHFVLDTTFRIYIWGEKLCQKNNNPKTNFKKISRKAKKSEVSECLV